MNLPDQPLTGTKGQQREQEVLKKIVQRTAENLIDISSIRLLDRIQHEHAVERAKEYRVLLQNAPELKKPIIENPPVSPIPFNKVLETLTRPPKVSTADLQFAKHALEKIRDAMTEMKVVDVGEIVVPLR
ncbi:hypothetical protein HDV05_007975 [Chytridiales sp. JEL 0842]|nr:hypothetical protein HDV05_007975 [Chytridiales sp. JEL 0842]